MASTICYYTIDDFKTYEKASHLFALHNYPIECYIDPKGAQHGPDIMVGQLAREGARILISRGGTAIRIQETVSALVVPLSYDFLDFYNPLLQARKNYDRVALVGWYEHLPRFYEYKELFPKDIHYYEMPSGVPDYKDITDMIKRLKQDRIQCVVSGSTIATAAQYHDIPNYLVGTSESVLLQAAREALSYAQNLDERELWYNTMAAILENVREGFIYSDLEGNVLQTNPIASRLLNVNKKENASSVTLSSLGLGNEITDPLLQGRELVNKVVNLYGGRLIINGRLLRSGSQQFGMFLTIESADNVRAMDNSLRRDIIKSGRYARYNFSDIVGNSSAIRQACHTATLYASSPSTVLITGESGTGKELFAQSIHNASSRSKHPFVAINCAALPEDILESELFGYVKGAFTGARSEGKVGIFEQANMGTIFLDEIGEISPKLQLQLLRVLQEKEITRIGDRNVISVDVRVIAATNRNLTEMVKNHKFREDLFYRICVLSLEIPPLRKRKEDIGPLLKNQMKNLGRAECTFTEEAMEVILNYDWPGNVRELQNFTERLTVLEQGSLFDRPMVQRAIIQPGMRACSNEPTEIVAAIIDSSTRTDEMILSALQSCLGDRQKTAEKLGISRSTLWRRLREIKLRRGALEL